MSPHRLQYSSIVSAQFEVGLTPMHPLGLWPSLCISRWAQPSSVHWATCTNSPTYHRPCLACCTSHAHKHGCDTTTSVDTETCGAVYQGRWHSKVTEAPQVVSATVDVVTPTRHGDCSTIHGSDLTISVCIVATYQWQRLHHPCAASNITPDNHCQNEYFHFSYRTSPQRHS